MNVRPGNDGVKITLDADEATLMRDLLREMHTLIEDEPEAGDPVMERLMPAAYEDADEQAKYEEVIGDSLRRAKLDALAVVEGSIEERADSIDVTVTNEQASSWLGVLTDTRLALAMRVGVTREMMDRELDPSDPSSAALSIVHWLGWLQESLIQTLEPT